MFSRLQVIAMRSAMRSMGATHIMIHPDVVYVMKGKEVLDRIPIQPEVLQGYMRTLGLDPDAVQYPIVAGEAEINQLINPENTESHERGNT